MSMLGSSLDVNHAFVLRSGIGTPLGGGGGGGGGGGSSIFTIHGDITVTSHWSHLTLHYPIIISSAYN